MISASPSAVAGSTLTGGVAVPVPLGCGLATAAAEPEASGDAGGDALPVADDGAAADALVGGDDSALGATVIDAPAEPPALPDDAVLAVALADGEAPGVPVEPAAGATVAMNPKAIAATSPTIPPVR
jgi:hypothetical protein